MSDDTTEITGDDSGSGRDPADPGPRAVVPAHVTAFFAPRRADEPSESGATGAGIALTDGIETVVRPREDTDPTPTPETASPAHRITLDGEPASVAAVEGVLGRLGVPAADVRVTARVPVAAGFGVSGGAALGTALAAADCFGLARTRRELVAVAHAAEVAAGTGLGDVVAAACGGVPVRLAAGGPEHGRLDRIPARGRIEYVAFGELSTAAVLADDTRTVTTAGAAALDRLRETPTLGELFAAAREFASAADLFVPDVRDAVDAVRAAGGDAAMGMLGRTVIARGTGLSDAGYDPSVTQIDPAGARLASR
jgi:pantoate kinase